MKFSYSSARLRSLLDRLAVAVLLLITWQWVSSSYGEYWVSAPLTTMVQLHRDIMDGSLVIHGGYTIQESLIGFLIGGLPAVIIPFLLRRHPFINAVIDPFMIAGYGVPKIALAPIFIIWFGIGIESKIAVVAIATFFIVFFTTQAGVRSLNGGLVHMAQVAGASEWAIMRSVVLPSALPHIFSGIKIAAPYAVGAAVITEMISSNRGLGYMLAAAANNFHSAGFFSMLIAVTALVLILNGVIAVLERHCFRWRTTLDNNGMYSAGSNG